MTTDQFKINLRNLRLKVGDKIMLKWMSPVIDTSVHMVTEELLQWSTIDEKRKCHDVLFVAFLSQDITFVLGYCDPNLHCREDYIGFLINFIAVYFCLLYFMFLIKL